MVKRAGICLYLFGSTKVIGQVRLDLSEFAEMRLPLGKLPMVVGIINPLGKKPLTNPLIQWGETILGYRLHECPTVSSITELVKAKGADIVVIHQPTTYNQSLLRQAILGLLKEGIHILLSGETTKHSLIELPVDIPIAAHEDCEFPDDDGNACQRNALARVTILRNLSKEFLIEILEFCLKFSGKFGLIPVITYLTRLKRTVEVTDRALPTPVSRILEVTAGFKTGVMEYRYLCRLHNPSERITGKLVAVFGTSGALNRPVTGSGKSEYLGKLARAHGTSVFTGLARESRAEIRGIQFIYVETFDEIETRGNFILVDEFHTIRGYWNRFLERALRAGKTVVVALPFSDADGKTSERAAEIALLADDIFIHEATCWQCQSPAYRLTCWKKERDDGRRDLSSSEIVSLRTAHVRIEPDLKWDAVCLIHHPLILSEPAVRFNERKETDDFGKLQTQRRLGRLGHTVLTITKWVVFLLLGVIVWRYWSTLQPIATQIFDLAQRAIRTVWEIIPAFARFYAGLPLLVRRPLEATILAYVVLRLVVGFWRDDRISRRNTFSGSAIWTVVAAPTSGLLYLTLGSFALFLIWVGAIGFLFILIPRMAGKIYGFNPIRRKKIGR